MFVLSDAYAQKSSSDILTEYCQYKKSQDPNYVCSSIPKTTSSGSEAKKYLGSDTVQNTNEFTIAKKQQNNSSQLNVDGSSILGIGIILIISVIVIVAIKSRKGYTMPPYIEDGLNTNFRNWDPRKFEEMIADTYQRMGYETRLTTKGPDQGIDVIAQNRHEKIVIQAKCWQNKVSNTDVLKTVGAREMAKADKAIVITNSEFTRSAYDVQQSTSGLELIDKEQLRDIIKKAHRQK